MNRRKKRLIFVLAWISINAIWIFLGSLPSYAVEIGDIQKRGVLNHLGIPYANFVTGSGDGLDVELVQLFAKHLGVKYKFVETSWDQVIADLTGKKVEPNGQNIRILGDAPIKGDIVANGFTILPWREKIVEFSTPTFPSQIWLMARADSTVRPIHPSGNIEKDIASVKALLKGYGLLGIAKTCLDPSLYALESTGAKIKLFEGKLNEIAPAVIKGESEIILLDVPDALIALEKWPEQIKVIGPLSPPQYMGCAFSKDSPQLRKTFNHFFEAQKKNGTYAGLIKKYYRGIYNYFPEFFKR